MTFERNAWLYCSHHSLQEDGCWLGSRFFNVPGGVLSPTFRRMGVEQLTPLSLVSGGTWVFRVSVEQEALWWSEGDSPESFPESVESPAVKAGLPAAAAAAEELLGDDQLNSLSSPSTEGQL